MQLFTLTLALSPGSCCVHTLQLTSFQSFAPPKSPKMGDFEQRRLDFGEVPRMG
jgi:hypothetical protein